MKVQLETNRCHNVFGIYLIDFFIGVFGGKWESGLAFINLKLHKK